jgi:hypothetical protein
MASSLVSVPARYARLVVVVEPEDQPLDLVEVTAHVEVPEGVLGLAEGSGREQG